MKTILKRRHLSGTLAAVLVLGALLCAVPVMLHSSQHPAGLEILQMQEQKDTASIEAKIRQIQLQQLGEQIEKGNLPIYAGFEGSVILGDSRVMGFSVYDYLPESMVLAGSGHSIADIDEHLETIARVQPEVLYLAYGVNDMGLEIGKDLGENGYGTYFSAQVDKLLEASPNSQIVVNSIIATTPQARESSPAWENCDDFNRQLQEICAQRGWIYVDNTSLDQYGLADVYQADGVHLIETFYEPWSRNMLACSRPQLFAD